jgi:hypothetical protein
MNTAITTTALRQPKHGKVLRRLGGIVAGFVLVTAIFFGSMVWRMNYVPANLDYATTRLTERGLYEIAYEPSQTPIPINKLHSWTLSVTTPEGRAIKDAIIKIDGDMPQHGHGLPTQPQVTQYLGNGDYLVEGVKFQMGGWWVMDVEISAGGQSDAVRFNFLLAR